MGTLCSVLLFFKSVPLSKNYVPLLRCQKSVLYVTLSIIKYVFLCLSVLNRFSVILSLILCLYVFHDVMGQLQHDGLYTAAVLLVGFSDGNQQHREGTSGIVPSCLIVGDAERVVVNLFHGSADDFYMRPVGGAYLYSRDSGPSSSRPSRDRNTRRHRVARPYKCFSR